jgi:hypothetical protein
MKRLVLEGWLLLLYLDLVMRYRDFKALHRFVREQEIRAVSTVEQATSKQVCHAVDLACVFYFKRVLCLQRSAATVVLLRRHGRQTEMVIGAQMLPFKSHAWVEIEGVVVNDRPYMHDLYRVLERC